MRPVKRVPGNGAVIATPAYFMTAGPFPECPRRGAPKLLREGSKPDGRDAKRLGSQEPDAAEPHARKRKNSAKARAEDLDFLARIRLRVIDPDLKHGKTLL